MGVSYSIVHTINVHYSTWLFWATRKFVTPPRPLRLEYLIHIIELRSKRQRNIGGQGSRALSPLPSPLLRIFKYFAYSVDLLVYTDFHTCIQTDVHFWDFLRLTPSSLACHHIRFSHLHSFIHFRTGQRKLVFKGEKKKKPCYAL